MSEYTTKEIDGMRRKLAQIWHETVDHVTEAEARYYLRHGTRGARAGKCDHGVRLDLDCKTCDEMFLNPPRRS